VATAGGGLGMVALCALFDLKVNFLDFVALPITLGLGVDYAINVAHRHRQGGDPVETLRTSGSAVFVCSLTTIIGYGSLLASENLAIRGFGLASLIGEVSCLLTALVLVPAIVSLPLRRRSESADRTHAEQLSGVEVV
jgi:predicted RND superfamily exporter protein